MQKNTLKSQSDYHTKHKDDRPLVLPYLPSYRVAGAISFASSVQLKYFKLLAAPTAIFFSKCFTSIKTERLLTEKLLLPSGMPGFLTGKLSKSR